MIARALSLVREGRLREADEVAADLTGPARLRVDLALAVASGQRDRALELAASLWHTCNVDPTVLSVLVHFEHSELRQAAADLLERSSRDAAADRSEAWDRLTRDPADVAAWKDVLSTLIASGRDLEALDGVARALGERRADFTLWALLATTFLLYRRHSGLLATPELGHKAFADAPEVHALSALVHLGLGDGERADREFLRINRDGAEPELVAIARRAMEAWHARRGEQTG